MMDQENQVGLVGLERVHPFGEIGRLGAEYLAVEAHVNNGAFGSGITVGPKLKSRLAGGP